MHNELTAIIEPDGKWYIAYCPEVPGANGQGKTIEECKNNLAAAISLIFEDRRQEWFCYNCLFYKQNEVQRIDGFYGFIITNNNR